MMNVVATVCFIAAAGCAVAMALFDKHLQHYRSPHAPAESFRWIPLRWGDPRNYEPEGQRYRSLAIRSWWMTVALFLAGVVAAGLGG
ncbi:MAG: hypothetical protein GTO22_21395 [Gemmatimonadales bacterium]|nr:hypothetical protein [Gemmatimonadales bacterium]